MKMSDLQVGDVVKHVVAKNTCELITEISIVYDAYDDEEKIRIISHTLDDNLVPIYGFESLFSEDEPNHQIDWYVIAHLDFDLGI
jgi:hypothetical protein